MGSTAPEKTAAAATAISDGSGCVFMGLLGNVAEGFKLLVAPVAAVLVVIVLVAMVLVAVVVAVVIAVVVAVLMEAGTFVVLEGIIASFNLLSTVASESALPGMSLGRLNFFDPLLAGT